MDLHAGTLASFVDRPGVQPAITVVEFDEVPKIVRANAEWQAAIRKRGIADPSKVMVDPWAAGLIDPEHESGRALGARARVHEGRQQERLRAADRRRRRAREHEHRSRSIEVTTAACARCRRRSAGARREIAPAGSARRRRHCIRRSRTAPSFTVRGQEVRWQKWRFRYTMHPREGARAAHGRLRGRGTRAADPVPRVALRDGSCPTAIPTSNWRWRSAFDVGEYGIGRLASSIEAGHRRAARTRTLIDATFADDDGEAVHAVRTRSASTSATAGCCGSTSSDTQKTNVAARARAGDLFIATIGNYDYAINWIFHQDGIARGGCRAHGHHAAEGRDVKPRTTRPMHGGRVVAPGRADVVAPHHQHFFNFRLDFDVDGPANRRHEMNMNAVPRGTDNPSGERDRDGGNAAGHRSRPRSATWTSRAARRWAIVNPSVQNALGQPPATCSCPATIRCRISRAVAGAPARRLHRPSLLGDAVRR